MQRPLRADDKIPTLRATAGLGAGNKAGANTSESPKSKRPRRCFQSHTLVLSLLVGVVGGSCRGCLCTHGTHVRACMPTYVCMGVHGRAGGVGHGVWGRRFVCDLV